MNLFKWLVPGISIKRWFIFHFISLVLLTLSVHLAITNFNNNIYTLFFIFPALLLYLLSLQYLYKRFIKLHKIDDKKDFADIVYTEHRLSKGPRIVAIGGGTGLSTLLQGLKKITHNLTAVVTVSDDGGSSGILRESYDVLPPGDIRNCLVALADSEPLMRKLFQYRFPEQKPLSGHTVGNLVILALRNILGNFETAIQETSKILAIKGKVVPASLAKIKLIAQNIDGSYTEGEQKITKSINKISKIQITPENAQAATEAVEAIKHCDAIVIGPGSLYTSIMPNLLIKGIKDAIINSSSRKIYICNIMTQEGETDHYSACDHIRAIVKHCGAKIFDHVIVQKSYIDAETLKKYQLENAYPVAIDEDAILSEGVKLIPADVINIQSVVRHDSEKLSYVISGIIEDDDRRFYTNNKKVHDTE
ncbi:MAG: YvcK family protein [Candidatus Aureabacteria bacterium]|nr:YvcK family protein [Candidatus Auribacterota bacterium]